MTTMNHPQEQIITKRKNLERQLRQQCDKYIGNMFDLVLCSKSNLLTGPKFTEKMQKIIDHGAATIQMTLTDVANYILSVNTAKVSLSNAELPSDAGITLEPGEIVEESECTKKSAASSSSRKGEAPQRVAASKRKADASDNKSQKKKLKLQKYVSEDQRQSILSQAEKKAKRKYPQVEVINLKCPVEHVDACCDDEFINKEDLERHLYRVHRLEQFRCLVRNCKSSFKYVKRFCKHLNSHVKGFTCAVCGQVFPLESFLVFHVNRFHQPGSFACSKCGFKSSTNRDQVLLHQLILPPKLDEKTKLLQCPIDGCKYMAKHELKIELHQLNKHIKQSCKKGH